jgi:hypothetical protein
MRMRLLSVLMASTNLRAGAHGLLLEFCCFNLRNANNTTAAKQAPERLTQAGR